MKILNKIIIALSLALVISIGGIVGHVAVRANAAYPPEGIEVPILMYHHVLKETSRLNQFTISPDEFRQDLQYLKDNGYTTILIQDLIDYAYEGKALPEKPVVITFDDGYESFHEYVYPMLKEYEFKAVYSIVGRYADQYSQTDDHHIRYSHSTWNQLALMQDSGLVEIQNHTYNLHENSKGRKGSKIKSGENVALYRNMLEEDLDKVQVLCREYTGWSPTTFTYPFGYICNEALAVIKDMGFKAALTCEEKLNYITGDPEQLYHLYRFNRPYGTSAQQILEKAHA